MCYEILDRNRLRGATGARIYSSKSLFTKTLGVENIRIPVPPTSILASKQAIFGCLTTRTNVGVGETPKNRPCGGQFVRYKPKDIAHSQYLSFSRPLQQRYTAISHFLREVRAGTTPSRSSTLKTGRPVTLLTA